MKVNDFFCTVIKISLSKPRWLLSIVLPVFLLLYFQSVVADPISGIAPQDYPKFDPARLKERMAPPEEAGTGSYVKPQPREKINKVEVREPPSKPAVETLPVIKFKLTKIIIDGITVYKKGELVQYYKPYLNKDISFQDLQNIANDITARYRKDGYMLSRAIVPAQEIKAGEVDIQVIEGYISEIYIEGDVSSKIRADINKCGEKIKQMRPLQINKLERYVLMLNDVPGLTAKTVLSPASNNLGAAELTFVIEQKRAEANFSYDNRGTLYMGPDEAIGMVSVRDFIVGADNLSLQTVDTPTHSELRCIQVLYGFPLGINGWRVNFEGNFTETNPGYSIKELDIVGRSKTWNIEIEYPLLRSRTKNVWVYGEFEWLDTYTHFKESTVFKDQIRSLKFGASYDFIDEYKGGNLIGFEISKGLVHSPFNQVPPLSRPKGRSDYLKTAANVSRYQSLGDRFVLLLAGSGQWSFNQQMLSAKEFAFGGQQFGRAYDPSEIAGDSGIVGKIELRANTYPNLRFLQQIQCYTFYDIGVMWSVGVDEVKNSGSCLGGGLRTTFDNHFYGNIELTKPLTTPVDTQVSSGVNGKGWRLFYSLGLKM